MNAVSSALSAAPASGLNEAGHTILWFDLASDTHEECRSLLRRNGYAVETVLRGSHDALQTAADIVIVNLPHAQTESLTVCQHLSETHSGALLALAPQLGTFERIAILEFGADGVLCSLSHPMEILASVRALLRFGGRSAAPAERPAVWLFDVATGAIRSPWGSALQLTPADTELLRFLASRPRQLVDRKTLLEVLHTQERMATPRSIDVRVARLRRALAQCPSIGALRTVHGQGYVWDPDPTFRTMG